jgi:ketosteroid isomerase-like protein
MRRTIAVTFLVLSLIASASVADPADDQEIREDSLRETEIAFAACVRDRDIERFATYIAEEALFLGSSVLRGREAILAAWQVFFAEDGPCLEWYPEIVEIGEGGDVGITRGPYTFTSQTAEGRSISETGVFTSVWRRRADGSWQVIFDAGCPACPDTPSGPD